ncbi:MAG: DUF484 domain-containing protein [Pantoea sp.]|uniref:DUF484 domain-containing protein n=1 Tax=Mixta sp. BE291 TaxID=3158787 RepID=UPI002857E6AF|nr:uncharacterized protein YigA (DUF484 family) [Pantoea alhagi]MDU4092653.1 DUF484 domain-containing protein [Pantoea sp.]
MKNVEETAPALMLNDEAVGDYLRQNPDFFIRNARQVEQMSVPHPVRGTVSLVEWHMARQRNHIQQLEEEITQLMEQASANHQLFDRLLSLQSHLASAPSLQDMLNRLQRWARDLGLAGADVRLFSDRWQLGAPSSFTQLALSRQAFEPVRIQLLGKEQHYLGSLNGPELLLLLPQARSVGSVAMSLFGERGDLGVLIFSSRDMHHYQTGQGTLLLHYLALMLPELLNRWVARA